MCFEVASDFNPKQPADRSQVRHSMFSIDLDFVEVDQGLVAASDGAVIDMSSECDNLVAGVQIE